MKSHTGGILSLGKGAAYSTSSKQKLVARSSTEAELIGMHDVLPQVIWVRNFLTEQGFDMEPAKIYQDNQSAILLEKNGRASAGKRSKHIDLRYFFAKDRIESGDIEVDFTPTTEMLADFFTKPLQGELFRKFRNLILNLDPNPIIDAWDLGSVLENEENESGRTNLVANEQKDAPFGHSSARI